MGRRWMAATAALLAAACGGAPATPPAVSGPAAKPTTILVVTIDTLRADRVRAYGWAAGATPAIDALATRGVRFDRAYAPAPITLPSHASLLTGLAPPKHGARHNGQRVRSDVVTLAERLKADGWATGAFVAAFPLDRRFGLDRGFDVYGDALPRGPDGRPLNERPGTVVTDEALAFLRSRAASQRMFVWVHLFEPHAPYVGQASGERGPTATISQRYDSEVTLADAQVGRLVAALGPDAASTLVVVTSDHGEAFGEHGEIGHSVFVYDTTLRVPLVVAGAGLPARAAGTVIGEPVSLVDVMPTLLDLVGVAPVAADGVTLRPLLEGRTLAPRALYAESFAPLLDFGWSPLRSLREQGRKYIAAPRPELYDVAADPGETRNLVTPRAAEAADMAARVERLAQATPSTPAATGEAAARLQSLGYLAGGAVTETTERPDPKDRVALAARIANVTSGELTGPALRTELEALVRDEPRNGQMQMRLGFVLLAEGDCAGATRRFEAAIAARVPSAEPHLGLAECLTASGRGDAAMRALATADRLEPGNPVVLANLGLLALAAGLDADAVTRLRAALERDPGLDQARFALARAYGRSGRRADAAREAQTLLDRLPAGAPQRAEVERLLRAVQ